MIMDDDHGFNTNKMALEDKTDVLCVEGVHGLWMVLQLVGPSRGEWTTVDAPW